MALKTSLVIAGDASGAQAALESVDQGLERNSVQAEAMAKAFANADVAVTRLAAAQTRAKQETDAVKAAFAAGEISIEQYNRELLETKSALSLVEAEHRVAMTALRQNKQALDASGVSLGQARAGYQNFGRQVQDVAVQLQTGANLGTIIGMQGPQIADAVAMMGGRFSGLASFLAGPWGAAVFVGTSVLVDHLIPALFDTGDAADEGTSKTYDFTDGLNVLQLTANETADAMKQLANEMRGAIAVQGDFLRQKALIAGQSAADIQGRIATNQGELSRLERYNAPTVPGLFGLDPVANRIKELRQEIAKDRQALEEAQRAAFNSEIAASQSRVLEGLDAATAATGRYKRAVGELEKQREQSLKDPVGASAGGIYITEEQYQAEFARLTKLKNAEVEAARAADRTTRKRGGNDAEKAARAAAREASLSEQIARRIGNITDRFSDLPSEVERANSAMRELDKISGDIKGKNLPESLLGDVEKARTAVQDSLIRPFNEYLEKARQAAEIDRLLIAGKEDEAEALKVVLALQEQQKDLNDEQLATVLETVRAERLRSEELARQQEMTGNYLDVTRSVRGEIEAILAGQGKLSNFKTIARQLQAKVWTEQLFGPALRALDEYVKNDTFGPAVDTLTGSTERASTAIDDMAKTVKSAIARIDGTPAATAAGTGANTSASEAWTKFLADFDEVLPKPITVTAKRITLTNLTPAAYFDEMTRRLTAPLLSKLDETLGIKFFTELQGVLSGAISGYLTAGPAGGILGALKSIPGLSDKMDKKLGVMMKGAETGTMAAGIMKTIGIKTSTTGAQVGGAIGSATGIPGGDIIGSIIGGVIGGMFKKSRSAGAVVTGPDSYTLGGKDKKNYDTADSLAGALINGLQSIADQFGADVGSFYTTIGVRDGDYRVNTSGSSLKIKNGAKEFDDDQAGAIAYAIADAIADGAIKGLSPAIQKALKSSPDLNKAMEEAMKVQDVELAIGGIGAEIEKAFKDFERQAKERLRIATDYGFDVVAIEERNAKDRLKLSEQLLEQQVGSLQALIDEMTSGSLFEGSAVDQRNALLTEIEKVRSAANAGEEGAADKLAQLLEQLNSVSRDAYGTTGGFADDRAMILDAARETIAKANQRISDAQATSDPALATTNATLDEIADQSSQTLAELAMSNKLLAQIAGRLSLGGGNLQALREMARTSR